MKIGVLGAGQLGRMLALAGAPLGMDFHFFDERPATPASKIAKQTTASFQDKVKLSAWAASVDVITYEFENVPLETVRFLEGLKPVSPNSTVLEIAQDRLLEKNYFKKSGIKTPRYLAIETPDDFEKGVKSLGLPCVLKTRRMGYDGKGQYIVKQESDVSSLKESIGTFEAMILEEFVEFDREISLIGVRGKKGEKTYYPLVENHHREGVLRVSLVPAVHVAPECQKIAIDTLSHILDATDYVGALTVEFFEKKGTLLANEMAPRVHNSGHWTIEGARTSQFENHLRALASLPLGFSEARGPAAMINIIGRMPNIGDVLQIPEAHFHDYQKTEAKGRKLGHVTILADKLEDLSQRLTRFKQILG